MDSSASRIVVGLDGTDESLAGLRWAVLKAADSGQVVEVVHCYYWHTLRDFAFSGGDELRRGSECMLDNEVAAALRGIENPPSILKSSLNGRPVSVLAERAAGAAMVVIGSSAGPGDGVIGHVAHALPGHINCPMVTISRDGSIVHETVAGGSR